MVVRVHLRGSSFKNVSHGLSVFFSLRALFTRTCAIGVQRSQPHQIEIRPQSSLRISSSIPVYTQVATTAHCHRLQLFTLGVCVCAVQIVTFYQTFIIDSKINLQGCLQKESCTNYSISLFLLDYSSHNGGERGGERYVDTLKSKTIETVEREEMYSDANF